MVVVGSGGLAWLWIGRAAQAGGLGGTERIRKLGSAPYRDATTQARGLRRQRGGARHELPLLGGRRRGPQRAPSGRAPTRRRRRGEEFEHAGPAGTAPHARQAPPRDGAATLDAVGLRSNRRGSHAVEGVFPHRAAERRVGARRRPRAEKCLRFFGLGKARFRGFARRWQEALVGAGRPRAAGIARSGRRAVRESPGGVRHHAHHWALGHRAEGGTQRDLACAPAIAQRREAAGGLGLCARRLARWQALVRSAACHRRVR